MLTGKHLYYWLVSHETKMATEPIYIKQNTKRIAYIHIETSENCKIVLALTAAESKNITDISNMIFHFHYGLLIY